MFQSDNKQISPFQWKMIAKLLERHNGLKETLEMLLRSYPDNKAIGILKNNVEQGKNLREGLPLNHFYSDLTFLSDFISLDKSILIALEMEDKRKRTADRLVRKNGYQLILLLAAISLLILFTHYVFPVMGNSIVKDNSLLQGIDLMIIVLNVLKWLIIASSLTVSVFLIHEVKNKRINYLWMWMHRHKTDKLVRQAVTYEFAGLFKCLLDHGISFIEAVSIIRHRDPESPVSLLAHHFDEALQQGTGFEKSLEMEFFDGDFYSLCLYGIRNSMFEQGLDDYLQITEMKLDRMMDRISLGLQIFIYGFTGAVILTAYRILMLPLELLGGL